MKSGHLLFHFSGYTAVRLSVDIQPFQYRGNGKRYFGIANSRPVTETLKV